MRGLGTLTVDVIAFLWPASADVQLSIRNGRVSLVAKDATVQQILTEWARVGQTKIVNGERISGGPVTLQLTNVSEQQVLDVLLRSVSGYLAAARATETGGASVFDRIVVLPTSVAPPASAVSAPSPVFSRPMPTGFSQLSEDDDGRRTPIWSGAQSWTDLQPLPAAIRHPAAARDACCSWRSASATLAAPTGRPTRDDFTGGRLSGGDDRVSQCRRGGAGHDGATAATRPAGRPCAAANAASWGHLPTASPILNPRIC